MCYNQLTENERYQIYRLKKAGHSQPAVARVLSRDPSTISRELQRNAGLRGYRSGQAQHFPMLDARKRTKRSKSPKKYERK